MLQSTNIEINLYEINRIGCFLIFLQELKHFGVKCMGVIVFHFSVRASISIMPNFPLKFQNAYPIL